MYPEPLLFAVVALMIALVAFGIGHAVGTAKARREVTPAMPPGAAIAPPPDLALAIHDNHRARIGSALAQGRKIEAIKLYREATGVGLKEAKDAVERWDALGVPESPGGSPDQWPPLPSDNQQNR